ncbi:hypothetical protein BS78_10G243800 [Paspalum vaginatum]|nr:hypothetical protein BS78_10G243800 [Paspalum vaginatum]
MSSSSPSSGGFVPDLAACRSMSVNEKRELVRELSKCHLSAPEQLLEWTRREISEVLCAELGRVRKEKTFSSMAKHSMLDPLFKVVKGESSYPRKSNKRKLHPDLNAANLPFPSKRQRKNGSSSLLPDMAGTPATTGVSAVPKNDQLCQNSACRATINPGDEFCKRCSCCICFKYDDNKDPTLWLSCSSDQPSQENSCGFSCHLECALEDKRSGIKQSGESNKLDSLYYCIQCGKQNDLLRCWEKQLLVAKNARRLDVLCHRIFLSHKILISTKKYLVLHNIVDKAMKKLEAEVGPIMGIQNVGHGLVGRLAAGAEVQKLCMCAIEALQSLSGSLGIDSIIQRSEIVTHVHTGNMMVDPPKKNSKGTENHKGDTGKSFEEAKSGNHVAQDSYLRAATDLQRSSCTAALGRFEGGRHKNGPADLSTATQTYLHRESSNLMLNNGDTFQQTLYADAARLENSSDSPDENELACHKTGDVIKFGNGISAMWSKSETCSHIPETGSSNVQREAITCNQPAPGQDSETSLSPLLAGTTDTVTEVVAPELAVMGGPSHTRMILLCESRASCSHIIQECEQPELIAYEIGKRVTKGRFKAEAARLTQELENAEKEKANAFMRKEYIEETLRTESEPSQRTETELLKEIEALRSDLSRKCMDLASIRSLHAICDEKIRDQEKEIEELNVEKKQANRIIDQVTKSSKGDNKALKDQVEELSREIEHASQTLAQVKKSSEGEKKALEDKVNKLNQRIKEASRSFELEKTMIEKAAKEKDLLTEELKTREERLMSAPDLILSSFARLQFVACQMRAEVIGMETNNPSVEDLLGVMDAQIRVLEARILMIVNDLENSTRDAVECSLRDFLIKIRIRFPDIDVHSLVPQLKDGDYRKVSDEVQPIAIELSKIARSTVICEGKPGNGFEEVKSGNHVLQNSETDPRSSHKRTSAGFEDGGYESGLADPNATVRTSLQRESSYLMPNSREPSQPNLNADAARLENAPDVHSDYELAGSQPCCGSPLRITGNEIKSGKAINAMGSELKSDYHTAQTDPLKPETEPESSSNKNLSGKPKVSHKDAHSDASYEHCAKVIRRLECEGYIESSFRMKFLTWFCLRATPHERRVVSVFVDTLINDPISLAAQLDETFLDAIYSKKLQRAPPGFCMELWH